MKTEEADPVIAEVREARHRISARFDHNARRLVEHYLRKRDRHQDPPSDERAPAGGGVDPAGGCSGSIAAAAEPGD